MINHFVVSCILIIWECN